MRAFPALCNPLFPRDDVRICGVLSFLHLASVPLIEIEIPQKGNAWHDVKGNSLIGPLNDVLVLANSHH